MTSLPWVTVGVDLFDVFEEQVRDLPDGLHVTVLCNVLSTKAAGQLRARLDSGRFAEVRVVVDRGAFQRRTVNATDGQVENVADVEAYLGAERIRGTGTHVKAIIWEGPATGCLVTSANLNHNTRPECHERADNLAPALLALADALFAELPEGVLIDSATAYSGIQVALNGVEGMPGVRVWRDGVHVAEIGAHLGNKIGMVDFLPLVKHVGAPARVWVSSWSIQADHIAALEALADEGVDVRVWLPARFARRGSNEKLLSAVSRIAPLVTWSPTHAKVLLIDGPKGAYLATGCANLGKLTALDLINLRRGGRELAEHGAAMLTGLPAEDAPDLPPPSEPDAPRLKAEKQTGARLQEARRFEVTQDTIAVSERFQPPTGLGASTAELEDELLRLDLLESLPLFVQHFWPVLNQGTRLDWTWHLDELCAQFTAFVHGTCAETTVNAQPPGTTKSTIVSQLGPVWAWLHHPHHRWGFASHSLAQALKDNIFRRKVIASPEFQRVFRPKWQVVEGQDAKGLFINTAGGSMRATSTGAKITGDHFDRKIGDDLLDGKDRAKPEASVDWTFNVFLTRSRDRSLNWLNGQRLHPMDPSGFALEEARKAGTMGKAGTGGVDYLCFPHHYAPDDPARICVTSTGAGDRRTRKGELLWPARFDEAWLAAKARRMSPIAYATQYEQDVNIDAVCIFPAEWWQRFEEDPGGGWLEVSVDSSNWSERKAADRTSITLARIVNGCLYRLRCWSGRFTLPEAVEIVAKISLEYPTVRRWHVEDKAGGRGFMQAMKAGGEVGGQKWAISSNAVVAVNPQAMGGDLTFRADAAAPAVRAGRCYVMADKEGDAFIETCAKFPAVHPDDDVASWVQLATDAQISKHLGSRRAAAPLPRFSAPTAEVERRRAAVRGLPGRR